MQLLILALALGGFFFWEDIAVLATRDSPRIFFVIGEKTPFTWMNTGSPGHTHPVVIGEQLTKAEAKKVARKFIRRWTHGQATIYSNRTGICDDPVYKREIQT